MDSPSSIASSDVRWESLSSPTVDLGTITELDRANSASPEPIASNNPEITDFGKAGSGPRKSFTHPVPHSGEDSEPQIRDTPQRANTSGPHVRPTYSRFGTPSITRRKSGDGSYTPKSPKRNSTVNTNASSTFEQTAPWDQKAILSLDGGGIRGYSALLIIQELMKAVGERERKWPTGLSKADGPAETSYHPLPPIAVASTDTASLSSSQKIDTPKTESSPWLPCHYLDYIAGTSTGGLISIMLGRLRMNIDDCIRDYENLGDKVFGKSRWFHHRAIPPFFWIREKYDHKILEMVIRDVVRKRVPKVASFPGGTNFAFDENRCRTVVIAYQEQKHGGVEKPYLFRTYKNLHRGKTSEQRQSDRNPALAHDIPIWQVARATSAAPTYFKTITIDELEYLDGGFGGTNNPCVEIYDEVCKMNNNAGKCVSVIVSVGTGKNNKISRFDRTTGPRSHMPGHRLYHYMNFAKKWSTDSENTHISMFNMKTRLNDRFEYFRLNVQEGIGETKLDEWRKRGKLRTTLGKCVAEIRMRCSKRSEAQVIVQEKPDTTNSDPSDSVQGRKKEVIEEKPGATHSDLSAREQSAKEEAIPKWLRPRNKTLEKIAHHTRLYLDDPEVKKQIDACADILVKGRRDRAKSNDHRWEKACFGAWYQCNIGECPKGEKEYQDREALRRHFQDKHRHIFSTRLELEAALDNHKIIVH